MEKNRKEWDHLSSYKIYKGVESRSNTFIYMATKEIPYIVSGLHSRLKINTKKKRATLESFFFLKEKTFLEKKGKQLILKRYSSYF